jgi:hypothetical protein
LLQVEVVDLPSVFWFPGPYVGADINGLPHFECI